MSKTWVFPCLLSVSLFAQEPAKPSMSYLSSLEKAVVLEVNRLRRDPQAYAAYVKEMIQRYEGNMIVYPGEPRVVTNEGVSAAKECYEFLLKTSPVDTLMPSKGMSAAAKDHAKDQGKTGKTGHSGSDGSSPFDRIERYGQWERTAGENIDYGHDDARRIVLSLIIDDGVPSRGHRANLFNPEYKRIGVACGPHKEYRHMCVMDLAGGFKVPSSGVITRGGEE